jgi:hypothetical protein
MTSYVPEHICVGFPRDDEPHSPEDKQVTLVTSGLITAPSVHVKLHVDETLCEQLEGSITPSGNVFEQRTSVQNPNNHGC